MSKNEAKPVRQYQLAALGMLLLGLALHVLNEHLYSPQR